MPGKENGGVGLRYENVKDSFGLTDLEKDIAQQKKVEKELKEIDAKMKASAAPVEEKKALEKELKKAETEKVKEQEVTLKDTRQALSDLRTDILADLDDNGAARTEVINDKRYDRLRDQQEDINQEQKDIKDALYKINDISIEERDLIANAIDKGMLVGAAFRKGLAEMYMQHYFPELAAAKNTRGKKGRSTEGQPESKAAQRDNYDAMFDRALRWADGIKEKLQDNGLWKDTKRVNRKEKSEDRKEKRAQRNTYENEKEILVTEEALQNIFNTSAKILGRDKFAAALSKKLSAMTGAANIPAWTDAKGMNAALENKETAQAVRGLIERALPYMTLSNFQDRLTAEKQSAKIDEYIASVEKAYGNKIDAKVQETIATLGVDPSIAQELQRKVRREVTAQVAAGYMSMTENKTTLSTAGLGAGLTVNGIDKLSPLIDRMTIGLGANMQGIPGFAIDFGNDVKLSNTTEMHLDAGIANFIIPFARVGIDQVINVAALKKNLEATRAWKVGAYAEAAPGYTGVGINVGSNLLEGISRQQDMIENTLGEKLGAINASMSVEQVNAILADTFSKADEKLLTKLSLHILDGLKQGYTAEDIAASFGAAWKNEAIKNTRGKVDFSAQAGVGLLFTVPVIKAFIGFKFYTRSTLRSDKFDAQAKEQRLAGFAGYQKFDNADVAKLSAAEKIAYRLGAAYDVTDDGKLITIKQREDSKYPIYDTLDIFVKDESLVKVGENEITFSKGSNIMMGKLIDSYKSKQKLYIGYDEADAAVRKQPLNQGINGAPETVVTKETTKEIIKEKTTFKIEAQDIIFDIKEGSLTYAEYFANAKFKCIDATKQVDAKKYVYNQFCADLINEITIFSNTKNATEADWNNLVGSFNQLMTNIGAETLPVKAGDPQKEIANQMLNTLAYSVKAWNLNIANSNRINSKTLPKDIPTLLNRKGAIAAFKKNGYEVTDGTFTGLYAAAKNEKLYKQVSYPNALAVVAYYRNIAPKTPMNVTGVTGFGGVNLAHGAASEKLMSDTGVDAKLQTRIIDAVLSSPQEFAAFKQKLTTMLTAKKIDVATLTDEDYKALLRGEKVARITLNKEFFKALNGPCVNEALVMNLLGIHIDGYEIPGETEKEITTEKPREGNIYVGMESIDTYQTANSFNVGIGTVIGNDRWPKPGNPNNPGAKDVNGNTTQEGNTGDGSGDGGDDNGNGGGDR